MIFLDTNIFLRYLLTPTTPETETMQEDAAALFAAVERGEEEITTTEVVMHEICYVLAAKKHYRLSPSQIADYLTPILRLPGFRLPRGDKSVYLRALEIYVENGRLGFADCVIAARAERGRVPVYTFDEALRKLPVVTVWQSPTRGGEEQ